MCCILSILDVTINITCKFEDYLKIDFHDWITIRTLPYCWPPFYFNIASILNTENIEDTPYSALTVRSLKSPTVEYEENQSSQRFFQSIRFKEIRLYRILL